MRRSVVSLDKSKEKLLLSIFIVEHNTYSITQETKKALPEKGKALLLDGSADEGLTEVDDASHDDDERDVDLDGEVQELALAADRADGGDGNRDVLRGDHLAGAGAQRIRGGNPGLDALARADGHGRVRLQLAEEDAGRGSGARDERADGADEGGDERVHRARRATAVSAISCVMPA